MILIVIIVGLPAIGIIVYAGLQQRNEALNVAKADTQKLADRITYEQQSKVAVARQLMASLSQMPEVARKDAAKVDTLLKEIHHLNPDFTNIFIADRSGMVWASAVTVKPPFIVSDRRYFKNTLATGQLSSGEYIVARAVNRPSFTLGYPIRNTRGDINGVVCIGFLLEKYTKLLERSHLPKNASFVLRDYKGTVLFRAVEPEKYIGRQTDSAQFKEIQEGPDESTVIGKSISVGDERIITTRKLRLEGEVSPYMSIRAGIPVESALSDANTHLLRSLLLFGGVLGLAFVFSGIIGERSILVPFELLKDATRNLANGKYQVKAVDLVKGGELGTLAKSFDVMAEKLVRREQALASSERFLNTIIDTEPECIKMLDIDCNLLMMNRAGLDMIDAESFEQVKGACVCPLITEPYRDAFMALTKRVFLGIPGTLEFETIGLKGRHIWLETHAVPFRNEQGEITALLGITRNITDRKRNEEQLKTSEENYRSLTGLTSDYVHRCSRTGSDPFRIQWIGGSVSSISGYSSEEILELGCWLPLVHPDDKQDVMSYLFSLVPGDYKQIEFRITAKEGHTRWISETSRCVTGDNEGELVLFGAAKNITERKSAELDRDNLSKQLLHAQKLESLGVLAGGIAHDFNNILTSIIGNADLALMRMNPESPAVDNLYRIEQAAARAADLAKQMLAYSGKGQFVVKYLDINQLLKDMLHLLEVSISKKVELRFNLSPALPSVEADVTQIQQIIMNLVINASEAIGDNSGVISITSDLIKCDQNYLNSFWLAADISAGEYVCLEISDTGCGMNKETLEKIFDPFFTTKFTGRGLGMAAVHGIIRGHKGAINVYSEPGKGTFFKVLLPASGKPVVIPVFGTQHDDWRGEGKVLLVDDENSIRDIGTAMLQELGYCTITANDGQEALEIFKATTDISLVILDLTMPQMDGEQCFRELRQLMPDVKVIMSSGFSEHEVIKKFAGKGLTGFIQKPYKLSVLKEALKKIQNPQIL
ncbi:MAG: PAS domain S-box protein [Desulfuromonadaceae bacterium]|nr:PAS domain S-box protein [Desulfuromonadaceae bacterium]